MTAANTAAVHPGGSGNAAAMRFALIVNTDDPAGQDPMVRMQNLLNRSHAAREAGFDQVSVAQRYSYGPAAADERGEPLTSSRFQPLLTLARLSGELGPDMGYLTSVLVSPGLHPVQLAEDVATLDAMCGGRLTLGLGLGWMPYEFEAFGVGSRERVRRFEELLTVYRGLMSGATVDLQGEHFSAGSARLVAGPATAVAPPLWVGANAEPAVRRAARLGDAWIMSSHTPVDELCTLAALYRESLEAAGKPVPEQRPVTRVVFVAKDRETALRQAEPDLAAWYRQRGEWGWFVTRGSDVTDAILHSGRWIIGSPDDCVRQILELRERLGATDVVMSMTWPVPDETRRLDAISLLGAEVLPRVRAALSATPATGSTR